MIIGIASGFYNPLTLSHLDMLNESKKIVDKLIVIVNNDIQVRLKGSIPFYNEYDRLYIVRDLKCVDKAYLSIDYEWTIAKTISKVYSEEASAQDIILFLNGGDRVSPSEEELKVCQDYNILTVYGVGGYDKPRSSSQAITNAAREWFFRLSKKFPDASIEQLAKLIETL